MLKFSVRETPDLGDSQCWTWSGREWRCGESSIEPYDHPALVHEMITDGAVVAVVSAERGADDHRQRSSAPARLDGRTYRERLAEVRRSPLDWVVIELRNASAAISAGHWAVAPLYLAADGEWLHASWDLADLRRSCITDALVDREIARLLRLQHRYGHDTPWQGVHRLTERSTASWEAGSLALRYPPDAAHTRPRALRPGADVLDAYEELLGRALTRRRLRLEASAVELSGGMDSANVAAGLATLDGGEGVAACAMLLGGQARVQQIRRRRELIRSLGFAQDLSTDVMAHLPLNPAGRRARGDVVSPYDDPWTEAEEVMMDSVAAAGVQWSFGGTGGDELTSLRDDERPPGGAVHEPGPWTGPRTLAAVDGINEGIAPSPVLHDSTLLAFACRSPQFMRNGLWPVSPLADPDLIRFAEWLPRPWREHKALHRLRLARMGFSPETVHAPIPENFVHAMNAAMRRHVVPFLHTMVRDGGVLIDSGFVDGAGLAQTVVTESRKGPDDEMDRTLFQIASTEIGLRGPSSRGNE
ncbi:hypothetical protein [Streptomyces sp. NRRL F-5123]|uniref:hypothetical protein n=1 Tax=Streptomyces sp. NRRL F-5123 TaxID=1463856 RepID=UPI000693EBF6|nr:hypothetical protein [Streptomyces sp. NRRL F-5123]